MRRGHTLLELTLVLLILSLLGSAGIGLSRSGVDRLAVGEARERTAELVHRARSEARLRGGARLRVLDDGTLQVEATDGEVLARTNPGAEGVEVRIGGGRDEAVVVYGPMGIGRAASLTLHFERGRARASLVISSYGRLRRDG